jgi:hypothetical protein
MNPGNQTLLLHMAQKMAQKKASTAK